MSKSVIVVGAGIVGLSSAFHLAADGFDVVVVDREPDGDKASFGNAGGIAVTEVVPASVPGLALRLPRWLLDPLGPLSVRPSHLPKLAPWLWRFTRAGSSTEVERIGRALSALNSRVYDDLCPMLQTCGLLGELQRRGALSVYESEEGFAKDSEEWRFKRDHGIEVQLLSAADARDMEPALGPIVKCGVFTPQWSHLNDPKRLVDGLRYWLSANAGVRFVKNDVSQLTSGGLQCSDGNAFTAQAVVVAAGAWSGVLAESAGDRVLLESERGYNTTLPSPGVVLSREVIFAERKFVATPLSIGLRIGGAAEFGGLNARPNYKRSDALVKLAARYLPTLSTTGGVKWTGHRPATPDSLPVIGRSPRRPNIIYAFGHGHLGLTQAATTGRLVADLASRRKSKFDLKPFSIERFET